jgi:hypothetical protein
MSPAAKKKAKSGGSSSKPGGGARPKGGKERRKAERRPIVDSFNLFVTVPAKGPHRLRVHDVSDFGIGFDVDTEGEAPEDFPLAPGEKIEIRFYFNPSLYCPLNVRCVRVDQKDKHVRRIGAELYERNSPGYRGYLSFLALLDNLVEVAKLEPKA